MYAGHGITINGITLNGPAVPGQNELFTADVLDFLAQLHREFAPRLAELETRAPSARTTDEATADWLKLVQQNLADPPRSFVTPRRLSRTEDRMSFGGTALSAGIVDFAVHMHRNAHQLISQGRAPFISLMGSEDETELSIWEDLFIRAEQLLGIPECTIRAMHMQAGEPDMDEDEDGQASSAAVLMARTPTGSIPIVNGPVQIPARM